MSEWQWGTTRDGRDDVAAIVSGTKLWDGNVAAGPRRGNGEWGCGVSGHYMGWSWRLWLLRSEGGGEGSSWAAANVRFEF